MRTRGRPKRTGMEAIKRDMLILLVTKIMGLKMMALNRIEWKKRIYVPDPENWDKGFIVGGGGGDGAGSAPSYG